VFDGLLPDRDAMGVATQGLGTMTRQVLRLTYPLIRGRVRKDLVNTPGGPEVCREKTLAALDRLESELAGGDYLVGGQFTVADLTAAALFFPLVSPPEFQYEVPDPWPEPWEGTRRSLSDRPGYKWVGEMYRRHRGTSAEVPA
jgi:glutathione S-transferase